MEQNSVEKRKNNKNEKKYRQIVKKSSICPQGLARCGEEVYYGYRVWGSVELPTGVR